MRIAVSSFGSEGDIRPFAALTRALRAAGHDAFLCAAEMFRERAEQAGIPLASTGPLRDQDASAVLACDPTRTRGSTGAPPRPLCRSGQTGGTSAAQGPMDP